MKASNGFTQPAASAAVAFCFLSGAICLSLAVRGHLLSTTLILGLGVEAVGAVAFGVFALGERLSRLQTGGIALVITGVALLRV